MREDGEGKGEGRVEGIATINNVASSVGKLVEMCRTCKASWKSSTSHRLLKND